jgi:hypothetical protein
MKTYRVSFDLILDDEAAHPRKWVAQCIWDALRLETGEDIDNIEFVEVTEGPTPEEQYLDIATELTKE